jgi:hypothetical protein
METIKHFTNYMDMLGFVRYTYNRNDIDDSKKLHMIVGTLGHDLSGLINEEPCFSPRVTGYRQKLGINV